MSKEKANLEQIIEEYENILNKPKAEVGVQTDDGFIKEAMMYREDALNFHSQNEELLDENYQLREAMNRQIIDIDRII